MARKYTEEELENLDLCGYFTKEEIIDCLKTNLDNKNIETLNNKELLETILNILDKIDLPDLTGVFSERNYPVAYEIDFSMEKEFYCFALYTCEITGYGYMENLKYILTIPHFYYDKFNSNDIKKEIEYLYENIED